MQFQTTGGSFSLSPAPAAAPNWHLLHTHGLRRQTCLGFLCPPPPPTSSPGPGVSPARESPQPGQMGQPAPASPCPLSLAGLFCPNHSVHPATSSTPRCLLVKPKLLSLAFKALNSSPSTIRVLAVRMGGDLKHVAQNICMPEYAPWFYTSMPLPNHPFLSKHPDLISLCVCMSKSLTVFAFTP